MGEAESAWSPVTESGGSRVTWYFGKDTICAAARKENWRSDCHSEELKATKNLGTCARAFLRTAVRLGAISPLAPLCVR